MCIFLDFNAKRAQASSEFLIMTAVVLIISLSVMASVGGFPNLTVNLSERANAQYWQNAEIILSGPLIFPSQPGSVSVSNNKNYAIILVNVSDRDSGALISNASDLEITLQPGTKFILYTNSSGYPCTGLSQGAVFSNYVAVFYKDAANNQLRQFQGSQPLSGRCQTPP